MLQYSTHPDFEPTRSQEQIAYDNFAASNSMAPPATVGRPAPPNTLDSSRSTGMPRKGSYLAWPRIGSPGHNQSLASDSFLASQRVIWTVRSYPAK
jgi:hypothetical protein